MGGTNPALHLHVEDVVGLAARAVSPTFGAC